MDRPRAFRYTGPMNAVRHALIREWVEASKAFDYCVQASYPAGLLDFVPPGIEDAWSIRAHIVHVLDADMMLHHRIRYAIAEPGTTILMWDQEAWHRSLRYEQSNVTAALSMLRMLRATTGQLLEGLDDATWEASWSVHPVKGRMGLDDWLRAYITHIQDHVAYVRRNEAAWEAQGGAPFVHPH